MTETPTATVSLTLNGQEIRLDTRMDETLLDVLRDRCGLMACKPGCRVGRCGACMVFVDDDAVNACLVPGWRLDGRTIVTVEGLDAIPEARLLKKALADGNAFQCGYCAPGMIVAATALLRAPDPTAPGALRRALGGNLCRCTGYGSIERAVSEAVRQVLSQR